MLFLQEAEQFHQDLGYSSADEFVASELKLDPDWVKVAVDWLQKRKTADPVPKADLDEQIAAAKANPFAEHGDTSGQPRDETTGRMLPKTGVDIINSGIEGGTSKTYLLRRIARDCPKLLDEIGPGKRYTSVRQAAIAVGIVKDVPTVRLTDPDKVASAMPATELNGSTTQSQQGLWHH